MKSRFACLLMAALGLACTKDAARPPPLTNEPGGGTVGGGGTSSPPVGDAATTPQRAIVTAPSTLRGLVVAASEIYVVYVDSPADGGVSTGVLARAPRAAAVATALAPLEPVALGGTSPRDLALFGASLYWLDDNGTSSLVRFSANAAEVVGAGFPTASTFAVSTTPAATVVVSTSLGTLNVDRVSETDAGASQSLGSLAGDFAPVRSIVKDGIVYVLVSQTTGGGLYKVPLVGGVPENVWSAASGTPRDLVLVEGRALVALDRPGDGAIVSIPLSGGAATEQVTGVPGLARLATEGLDLFFATLSGDVSRVPVAGAGATTVLAEKLGTPTAMVAADAVYVAVGPSVIRLAR